MSDHDGQAGQADGVGEAAARLAATEADKAKARKLFAHAKKASDTRNYDYAVELYVSGLACWPDAVEEGLKKLRVVATARQLEGGRSPGFMTARKYPTGGKDGLRSLNNALHLFGLNPTNLSYLENILLLAARARCDVMAAWIGPVIADAYKSSKKLPAVRYQASCEALDAAAEVAMAFNNDDGAIELLRANITTAQIWTFHYPDSADSPRAESHASGKLTILKGRFDKGEDFTESLKDAELQQDLHDRDKKVHTFDRTQDLIAKAQHDWDQNRGVPNKLLTLVDLMTRTESQESEDEAMRLLEEEFASSQDYVFKQKADELQIRQGNRRHRELLAKVHNAPDDAALREELKEHDRRKLEIETQIFEQRQRFYPTDLRLKFQLAVRYFRARRVDEAIPLFQESRSDGRVRAESRLYLGRCFCHKAFYAQAAEILQRGVDELEGRSDGVAFDLNYWLARALEADGATDEAMRVYGYVIQLDYNFRDARQRLEKLVAASEK
ncbi:MAG: hypothetical protein O6758_03200 [Planctomycetota bacterium]|nr:hypothetical protein [Planctomycetota bacterium]